MMAQMLDQFQRGGDFHLARSGRIQQPDDLGGQGNAHTGLVDELGNLAFHESSIAL
jgi:hypothetical protein